MLPWCRQRPQTAIYCLEWLGRLKCLATGLDASLLSLSRSRRCSRNRSPSRLSVSPIRFCKECSRWHWLGYRWNDQWSWWIAWVPILSQRFEWKDMFCIVRELISKFRVDNLVSAYSKSIKLGQMTTNNVKNLNYRLFKVSSNLRGCPPEKNSCARCFQENPHKLYINGKVIKCRIR